MNKVDKVKYIIELERKLAIINGKINTQRENCSHVSVDLAYYGLYPSTGDEYCCLLCGKGKNRDYYYDPRYMVHAEEYLPQYDIKDDEQCIAKFEHIQTLALGILKENPDMSNEELVTRLNNLIQESISYNKNQSGPKLAKTIKQQKKKASMLKIFAFFFCLKSQFFVINKGKTLILIQLKTQQKSLLTLTTSYDKIRYNGISLSRTTHFYFLFFNLYFYLLHQFSIIYKKTKNVKNYNNFDKMHIFKSFVYSDLRKKCI